MRSNNLLIVALISFFITATAITFGAGYLAAEKQPRMYSALIHLKKAEKKLENASHDKGGHRVKALKLIRAAKIEIRKGIEYDNNY
jgi:hypothetical protein